ncbi:MAG: hypothetical protein BGN82_00865 [Alphaproteobacteria bacterium 65-7]|nr:MAG: hypothetical protein BGN82_00865 [Alphaproteobacteria bacterium 65-7]
MGNFAGARDLRNLLGVAIRLRTLASQEHDAEDRALYLTAAEALEARAEAMARTLPEQQPEPLDPRLYQRVDLII